MARDHEWFYEIDWSAPLYRALSRLCHDVATVAPGVRVEVVASIPSATAAGRLSVDGAGWIGFEIRGGPDEESWGGGAADSFLDEVFDAPSEPWPVCAEHSSHSLVVTLVGGRASWVCPTSRRKVVEVGELHMSTRAHVHNSPNPGDGTS